jgi:hypothetical protein
MPMSALGQKQTSKRVRSMSALPPKADIKLVRVTVGAKAWKLGDVGRDPARLKPAATVMHLHHSSPPVEGISAVYEEVSKDTDS